MGEQGIDPGTEFVLGVGGGLRLWFGSKWAGELGLRFDQHFADWTYLERVSGTTGSTGDYLVRGFTLGIVRKF